MRKAVLTLLFVLVSSHALATDKKNFANCMVTELISNRFVFFLKRLPVSKPGNPLRFDCRAEDPETGNKFTNSMMTPTFSMISMASGNGLFVSDPFTHSKEHGAEHFAFSGTIDFQSLKYFYQCAVIDTGDVEEYSDHGDVKCGEVILP